jgi:hypothetical protein
VFVSSDGFSWTLGGYQDGMQFNMVRSATMYPLVNPIAGAPLVVNNKQATTFNPTVLCIDNSGNAWVSYDGLSYTQTATGIFPVTTATLGNPALNIVTNGYVWIVYGTYTSTGAMYNGYTVSSDGYTWVYRDAFNNNLFNLPCMQKLSATVGSYISSFIETSATTYTIRSICWDYTQSVWLAAIAWNNTTTVNSVYTYVAVSSDAISWASLQEVPSGSTSVQIDRLLVGYVNVLLPGNTTASNRFLASSNNSRVIASWSGGSYPVCASTDGGAWTQNTSFTTFNSFTTNGVVWVGCSSTLKVSDDLMTFSQANTNLVSRAVWSGKMWVFSNVDVNGNWSVYYTYDVTARASWITVSSTNRPQNGKLLTPYNLMYNGMYFIIFLYKY